MAEKKRKYRGFLWTETAVGLTLVGVIMACLAVSLNGFARLNHFQFTRQQCTLAAEAELDSIVVRGKPIEEADFTRLWPRMSVSIEQTDGAGQWQVLKLVKVKAKAPSFNKTVEIELSRYVSPEKEK